MVEQKLSESVLKAVRSGRTVQAIKQLRTEQGLGLKEAKDIIDRETAKYREQNPQAPVQASGSTLWLKVIVFAIIAGAVYWFLNSRA